MVVQLCALFYYVTAVVKLSICDVTGQSGGLRRED